MNRTQSLVFGFFVVVWASLLVILVAAPEVYDQALRLPTGHRVVELAVLAVLQLTGILTSNVPAWYVVFQGLLGAVQLGIGLAMVVGYRRAGAWGGF